MLFYRPVDNEDEYESESDDDEEIGEIDGKQEKKVPGETEHER